jgi:hypothetical protein
MSDPTIDDFFCWLENYPEEARNRFIDLLTTFFTEKVLAAIGPRLEELQQQRDGARSDGVEMAKLLKEMTDKSEEGIELIEGLSENWRKASRLAAKIATKWQDEIYTPSSVAAYLTGLTPPQISRLCTKGVLRSRNPLGHGRRREVHIADPIAWMRDREQGKST